MQRCLLIILGALFLSACTPEKNIQLNDAFWQQKQNKIAVAGVKPPTPRLSMEGREGLLDIAINRAIVNTLDTHLSKMDLSWYESLPNDMANKLKQHHIAAIVADNKMDDDVKVEKLAEKIAAQYHVNNVLIVQLRRIGVVREYSGFIPMSAPQAYCVLKGELINTTTKQVRWRHLAEVRLPIQGEWDQPPNFPNLSSSVKEAITASQQEIFDSFFSGH